MIPRTDRFRSCGEVLATRAGDEVVLVDLKTDRIYSLNQTAARAWELLSAACDRAEVERRMLEEFDVAPAELAQAIEGLITSLTEGGLLVRSE